MPTTPSSSASPSSRPPPVPRALLERIARPLLLRLLTPYDAALSTCGFTVAALAAADPDDRRPLRALHDLLDLDDVADAQPLVPLIERLASVAKVATPSGRDALVRMDTERRLPARLGAEDLAATACLDVPDLFALVRVGSAADAIKGFVLYQASATREPCFEDGQVQATNTFLAAWFERYHRTAYCDIIIKRRGPERHFEITHGRAPTTYDVIDDSLARKIVTQVNAQRSYAIYNEDTRLLAVHSLEFIKAGLRTAFGHGFAGDAEYFAKAETVLDMTPLRDLDTALAPDPALGVDRVSLRHIEITAKDGSSALFCAPKQLDLRATSQRQWIEGALREEGARVSEMKIALELREGKRALLVVIKADRNQLDYDRRDASAERALLELLTARGIWHGNKRVRTGTESVANVTGVTSTPNVVSIQNVGSIANIANV